MFAAAQPAGSPWRRSRRPGPRETVSTQGVVVSVDRAAARYREARSGARYMDAMTMPFAVGETKILDDVKPGDRIEAKAPRGRPQLASRRNRRGAPSWDAPR